jgi:TolB-like protein
LIETLPKRGYRWLPEITDEPGEDRRDEVIRAATRSNRWRRFLLVGSASLVLLLLFSTSFLWLVDRYYKPELVRVALIPIYVDKPIHDSIAANLGDMLRDKLLATNNLRFLAKSALSTQAQKPFSYYSREFGTRWIIEGDVRQKQDKLRISLSLVDANTALVVHTLTRDVGKELSQLDLVCSLFVEKISGLLELDTN